MMKKETLKIEKDKKKIQKKKNARESEMNFLAECNHFLSACVAMKNQLELYQQELGEEVLIENIPELTVIINGGMRETKRVKSVLNKCFVFDKGKLERNEKKRNVKKRSSSMGTIMFYTILMFFLVILGTGMSSQSESKVPKNIAGYAPMTILTKSMQSVYPQNSLIITKTVDPAELTIGEDITYLKENNTTVTHRIVGINENFMGTGKRGFETKGVDNFKKDEEIVRTENVIGKVIFSNTLIGEVLLFVRENLILTAIIMILFIYFIDMLIKYIATKNNFEKNVRRGKNESK